MNGIFKALKLKVKKKRDNEPVRNVPPQRPARRPEPINSQEQLGLIVSQKLDELAGRINAVGVVFPNQQQPLTQALTVARGELDNARINEAHRASMQVEDELVTLERRATALENDLKDRLKKLAGSVSYARKLAAADNVDIPQAINTGRNEVAQLVQANRFEAGIARIRELEKDISVFLRTRSRQAVLQATMESDTAATPNDVFQEEDYSRIDKATNRGGTKGHGKFGKILSAWSDVRKKPDRPDKVAALEKLVLTYMQDHPVQPDLDDVAQAKQDACREILDKIRELSVFMLRGQYDQLAQTGGGPVEQREMHVKVLAAGKGVKVPEGKGASDSFFLNDPTGRPAFIFKPMEGENKVEGFPQGGGAVREVMLSRLNDRLRQAIPGLEFGVCPTTVIELESSSFVTSEGKLNSRENKRLGAVQNAADCDGDLEKFIGPGASEGHAISPVEVARRRASIPVDDVQKIAVLDFLTLNLDRNAGNLLYKTQPDGSTRLIPIDAGNALPSIETFGDGAGGLGGQPLPGDRLLGQGNALMALEQAQQPFSDEMKQMISQIDPRAYRNAAQEEYDDLRRGHEKFDNMIDPSTFDLMERSATFLKQACQVLTPFETGIAYSSHFRRVLDAQPDELNNVIADVIQAAQQDAQLILNQTEYSRRFNQEIATKAGRIKSVDKTNFDAVFQQMNAHLRRGDYAQALLLVDQVNAEAQRVVDAAAQDPQAAIQAFLNDIERGGRGFAILLRDANAVPDSDQPNIKEKRRDYLAKRTEFERVRNGNDMYAVFGVAESLAALADQLLQMAN